MKFRSRLAVAACAAVSAIAFAATAHAAVVPVDPGKTVSAGKTILGTGQNLPSMNTSQPWDIGPFPAAQVSAYYANGSAANDQAQITRAALTWTKHWVKQVCGDTTPKKVRQCKTAAIFDIDDTLLSSYPVLSTMTSPFTYDSAVNAASVQNCTTPVIAPAVALFNSLKSLGVTPFLITGRGESEREATQQCLAKSGITGYAALILKPTGNTQVAAVRKAEQRKALIKQGWKIGPSIGDQVSDMALGNLTRGFLLPNVMYYLP